MNATTMTASTMGTSTTGAVDAMGLTAAQWERRARLQRIMYRAFQIGLALDAREKTVSRTAARFGHESAVVLRHLAARKAAVARRREAAAGALAPMANVKW